MNKKTLVTLCFSIIISALLLFKPVYCNHVFITVSSVLVAALINRLFSKNSSFFMVIHEMFLNLPPVSSHRAANNFFMKSDHQFEIKSFKIIKNGYL